MKVFVYGSLLSGLGNHHRLSTAKFLGRGTTDHRCKMISYGSFPAAWRDEQNGVPVVGEAYEVDARTLKDLDILEGNGRFYKREPVFVDLECGSTVTCWIYYLMDDGTRFVKESPTVEDCDWRKFVSAVNV
jgi:gamma-glutamylcyclotransferase (GGCT)/AIG2-like uncharacterized protein YtfP